MKKRTRRLSRSKRGKRLFRKQSRRQRGGQGGPTPPPGTAVIIEGREHRAMPFVLRNLLTNLPETWKIHIFYLDPIAKWLKNLLEKEFSSEKSRITTESLGDTFLGQRDYNQMMMKTDIYKRIPTETFLLVQMDSMICPPHKDLLQKFLDYDYVGAPWDRGGVGNGGFSLRKKSKLIEKIEKCPPPSFHNEDGYFATPCDAVPLRQPSNEEAREFAIETVYHPKSYGIHKAWHHLPHKIEEIEAQCPGFKELRSLQ